MCEELIRYDERRCPRVSGITRDTDLSIGEMGEVDQLKVRRKFTTSSLLGRNWVLIYFQQDDLQKNLVRKESSINRGKHVNTLIN